jgi:hypothetical protein
MTNKETAAKLVALAREHQETADTLLTAATRLLDADGGTEEPTTGGTTTGEPSGPTSARTIDIGVTAGLELVDHLDYDEESSYAAEPFNGAADPKVMRVFYHMDKSTKKACAPKDNPTSFRAFLDEDGDKREWYEKVWYYRLKKLRERFPYTKFIICTEIAKKPDGTLADFPNRNWLKEDWKDAKQVEEWLEKFITETNATLGDNWDWQTSSEPWDEDWQWFQRVALTYIGKMIADGRDIPLIVSPAFPIGQGETNEHGTNKYWGRPIGEFIPEDLREYYDVVSLHNYSLTKDNDWTTDLTGWNEKLLLFTRAITQLDMDDREKICTEFGFDMEHPQASEMIAKMGEQLRIHFFIIATIYSYRQQGADHFENCYLQNRDGTHLPAYENVTEAKAPTV